MPTDTKTTDAWRLERAIEFQDVANGPYTDHLTVDSNRHLVFSTMQASHQISIADYSTGKVLRPIPNVGNPHGIFFNPALNRLFVTDSGRQLVHVFDGDDHRLIKDIPTGGGEDGLATDPKEPNSLYVANGGRDVGSDSTRLTLIDMESLHIHRHVPVQTPTLEEAIVDPASRRIYVSATEDESILVIDQDSGETLDAWRLPESALVMSLALDASRHRIFAGTRTRGTSRRGSVVEIDTATGDIIGSWKAGGWIDNIWLDQRRERVFVSAGIGDLQTWRITGDGGLLPLNPVDTGVMAKTSYYCASVDRVFVAVPHLGFPWEYARVLVFAPVN